MRTEPPISHFATRFKTSRLQLAGSLSPIACFTLHSLNSPDGPEWRHWRVGIVPQGLETICFILLRSGVLPATPPDPARSFFGM